MCTKLGSCQIPLHQLAVNCKMFGFHLPIFALFLLPVCKHLPTPVRNISSEIFLVVILITVVMRSSVTYSTVILLS